MSLAQDVFQMIAIVLVSVINHYHIYEFYLFWDILHTYMCVCVCVCVCVRERERERERELCVYVQNGIGIKLPTRVALRLNKTNETII